MADAGAGYRRTGCPAVVIAGTSSGVGKTTVATGLIAALRARGLAVQPFKCGPDFLDPMHHAEAAGCPCINLDGWMLGPDATTACFRRHTARADFAVIEGVMGLFDGMDGLSDAGSTAQVAKLVGAHVVLVLDAWALARSAAAMALGYELFDPDLSLAGIVCNRVGGQAHAQWIADGIAADHRLDRVKFLGGLPKVQLHFKAHTKV